MARRVQPTWSKVTRPTWWPTDDHKTVRGGNTVTRGLTIDDRADQLLRLAHNSATVAHAAVARAVKRAKKPKGKQPEPDAGRLLLAAAIKRQTGCTKRAALLQAAEADEKMLRRLKDKIGKTSLETFARRCEAALAVGRVDEGPLRG